MKRFDYEFPVRIHFGQGCFEDSLKQELQKYGKNVMLAYGGGSLKRTQGTLTCPLYRVPSYRQKC